MGVISRRWMWVESMGVVVRRYRKVFYIGALKNNSNVRRRFLLE